MKTIWRILVIPLLVLLGCSTIPRSGALNVEFEMDKVEPLEKDKGEEI